MNVRILTLCLLFLFTPNVFAHPHNGAPIKIGELEISPTLSTVLFKRGSSTTIVYPNVRLMIKNNGASEIKVALLKNDLKALNDFGENLIANSSSVTKSAGIYIHSYLGSNFSDVFKYTDKFITIKQGQYIDASILSEVSINDESGEYYKTFRPEKITFSGVICTIAIDGVTNTEHFTLADMPVRFAAR